MSMKKENLLKHYGLSLAEYEKIVSLLSREPLKIELSLFSALWSEHCSYKSSKIHLKKFSYKSNRVIASFGENAGVIDLGEGEKIAFKIESHNHPSRIEPFHGAMTGVGGILRDIFAMNARPIALANYLCFGDLNYPITKKLLEGVVQGIGGYGNSIGIPMVSGKTYFHSSYNENILVNALALGFYGPEDEVVSSSADCSGAYVVYVGARTGRDGIHGASMSSEAFSSTGESKQSTVQVGDPFYGKLLMEACLESMKRKLVLASQDMGAAGLISSSFEMASKGNCGMELYLDQVPLRDSTMNPEEILLSESQERMLLVCLSPNYSSLKKIFDKWGLECKKIGEVTKKRNMNLYWEEKLLTSIDPLLLTEKAPELKRPFKKWDFPNKSKNSSDTLSSVKEAGQALLSLLKSPEGFSKEFIYRQYDQRVGSKTAWDASFPMGIVELPYTKRFLGLALGGRPRLLECDAFEGAKDALIYPALKLSVRSFEPLSFTNCLNFSNPEKIDVMSQFNAVTEAMAETSQKLSIPIVSGNVSFYNESSEKGVIPTPAIACVGLKLKKDSSFPKPFFDQEGSSVYLIYLHQCFFKNTLLSKDLSFSGNCDVSKVNTWMHKLISLSHSALEARVVGNLGLAFTLVQMSMKGTGVFIDCGLDPFQERLYEVIFTSSKKNKRDFESRLKALDLSYLEIGETKKNHFSYSDKIQLPLKEIIQTGC